ncbi:Selenoprotein F [Anabarilius grahami]|uniref:Selenoprotein F n=1 Tax=Anabarilius grahami TaxID=495550 RepID=A0A3N0YEZ5_ANAGA|nr:Selenoprotein F [Anabarilius grahami]
MCLTHFLLNPERGRDTLMAGEVYLLWLLPLLQTLASYGAELSSEACRELGFSSNLLCSSCDLLGQFSLNQLDLPCRQCCQEEAQLESRKYVRGSDPVLKLLDDNGNIAEELSILKWNTDSVEEFLSEKLDRI